MAHSNNLREFMTFTNTCGAMFVGFQVLFLWLVLFLSPFGDGWWLNVMVGG